ncbi:MAG: hypothetical protein WC243_04200 [Patescibacteria group bacterium]|jgi:hypothetical protein
MNIQTTNPRRKNIVFLVLVASFVLTALAGAIYCYITRGKPDITDTSDTRDEITVQFDPNVFLYNRYPDFDNLKLSDLPYFADVRAVFDRGDNILVMGVNQLAEYNKRSGKLLRTSLQDNPDFFSATSIGDLLYVSDNGNFFEKKQPKIYIVAMTTGKVEREIQGLKDVPFDLTNNSLYSHGNDLWIATRDTVIKYDTVKNEVTSSYSLADLGYTEKPTCDNPLQMIDEEGKVKVVEFACKNFISTYDYTSDSWSTERFDRLNPSDYINKGAKDFGLDIPKFVAMSGKVNDTYYALASNGIYKVTKDSLTSTFYESIGSSDVSQDGISFLDTKDGKTFVLVSMESIWGPIPSSYFDGKKISDFLTVKIIDTVAKTEIDAVATSEYANKDISSHIESFYPLESAKGQISGERYSIVGQDGAEIIGIDLGTKNLSLQ